MYYTLRQAAEALGMTRQGLKYWLDRLGEPLVKDDISGRYVVSDDALQSVKQARESASEAASEVINNSAGRPITKRAEEAEIKAIPPGASASEAASEAEAVALAVLREQIAVKDAQIAQLSAQLSDVTEALKSAQKALEGAQALHAATVHQLQEAKQEAATTRTEDVEAAPDDPSPSPSDDAGTRAPDPDDGDPVVPDPPKRSLWSRLFGRRS